MSGSIEEITRLYQNEITNGCKAISRHDIPISYEAITPDWLTDILCRDLPGVRVEALELGPADSGTSHRRRIHLTYNEAGERAGLPRSVFCKASHSLASRLLLGVVGSIHAEYVFYTKVRPILSLEAPTAYWANYNPASFASILVLHDLGEDVRFGDEFLEIDWPRAVSMVSLLAEFHGQFYLHPQLGRDELPFIAWRDWFERLNTIGFEEYTDKGFAATESVIPPRLFRRRGEVWAATAQSVARHAELPATLLHSDVHLKNWYVAGEGRMGLGDWQSACSGNWARDYAYAVACALSPENRRAWERELMAIYLDRMRAAGASEKIDFDAAWRLYRQQLFMALAFWTVTLTPSPYMPAMQPAPTSLAFIGRIAQAIDDLDALDSF